MFPGGWRCEILRDEDGYDERIDGYDTRHDDWDETLMNEKAVSVLPWRRDAGGKLARHHRPS